MAAGASEALKHDNFTVITCGYAVMRLAMVQIGWLTRLALPHDGGIVSFLLLAVAELLVPVWAERAEPPRWPSEPRYGPTPRSDRSC